MAVSDRSAERRANMRFPFHADVRYRVRKGPVDVLGAGRILDISSGGVRFTTSHLMAPNEAIELAMDWPAHLDGTCRLQFVAIGRIVRSDGRSAAALFLRHTFKTRAASATAMSAGMRA